MSQKTRSQSSQVDVTIIIPLRDEEPNISPLYHELCEAISDQHLTYEVIMIDDGSNDNTLKRLHQLVRHDSRFMIIEFTRNFGQTAALSVGFRYARGSVIVPMDGDMQNDPRDIPKLVEKLGEQPGWDIVSGWRKTRMDPFFMRRLPSLAANRLIRRLTWTREIHDFGCSLKAYRRETLTDIRLYGEMHRFIPAICKWRGARVTEMVVNHRPRLAGNSKYGLKRTIKLILDLITVKFLGDYLTKPIYFFGKLAIVSTLVGVLSVAVAIIQKFGFIAEHGRPVMLNNNVFILLSMMTFIMSIMFVMMGVLSELLVRIYHESHSLSPYKIRYMFRSGSNLQSPSASPGASCDR